VVNVICVAAMAVLGGMFARDAGRHALWGLAFAAYFGLVISVGRDTAEPLAEACMLAGLLAYRRGRWVLAGVAFGYGGITRETILLAPAAIAVVRLAQLARVRRKARPGGPGGPGRPGRPGGPGRPGRPGRVDLAWIIPAVTLAALQLAVRLSVRGGQWPLVTDINRNLTAPFGALSSAIRYASGQIDTSHLGVYDITLLESATLAIFVLAGFAVLFVTTAPVHERIAFVGAVLVVCALSNQIWGSVFGDGRSMIEVYLFAMILLIATPKRYLNAYWLGTITAWCVPALYVVARRRILYM
jgi:hypothetical protein